MGQRAVVHVTQVTARHKAAGPVEDEKHHRRKGKGGAAEGVDHIFTGGPVVHLGHTVHHQGDGGDGQHLVEEIHGQDVLRHGDAHGGAKGHGEEAIEHGVVLLVLHIIKGVQRRQRPQGGRQTGEQPARAVQTQREGQLVGELQDGQGGLRHHQSRHPYGGGADQQGCHHVGVAMPRGTKGDEIGHRTQHQRQKYRDQQKVYVHSRLPRKTGRDHSRQQAAGLGRQQAAHQRHQCQHRQHQRHGRRLLHGRGVRIGLFLKEGLDGDLQ